MNFSVYYQVYKNKNKTDYVLSKFREHHPTEFIYLISDGGDDFSDLAKKYNCHYVHDELNIGYYDHTHPLVLEHRKNNLSGGHPYGWTKNESDQYLKRFYNCCTMSNSEYIFLLEDDVIVNSQIEINKISSDVTFSNINNKFSKEIKNYLCNNNINFNIFGWGMCGGNFIKRIKYLEGFNTTWSKIYSIYDTFYKTECQHVGWQDVLFSLLLSESNPIVEINPLYSEYDVSSCIFHNRNHRK